MLQVARSAVEDTDLAPGSLVARCDALLEMRDVDRVGVVVGVEVVGIALDLVHAAGDVRVLVLGPVGGWAVDLLNPSRLGHTCAPWQMVSQRLGRACLAIAYGSRSCTPQRRRPASSSKVQGCPESGDPCQRTSKEIMCA